MAVDAGIYDTLRIPGNDPQTGTGLASLSDLASMQALKQSRDAAAAKAQADAQKAQREQQQQALVQGVFQKHTGPQGPDKKSILSELYTLDKDAAIATEKHWGGMAKEAADTDRANTDASIKAMDRDLTLLRSAVRSPRLLASIAPMLSNPKLLEWVGDGSDPEKITFLERSLMSGKEWAEEDKRISDEDKDDLQIVLGRIANARSQAHVDAAFKEAQGRGVGNQLAATGVSPQYSPEESARVNDMLMTADQRADNARVPQGQAPNIGSFEDYVVTKYGPRPTPPQIEAARKAYQQADDRPSASGAGAGLSPAMESNILNRITTQWAAAKKPAEELNRQAGLMKVGMDAARRGDLQAGAQTVLVTFQKILDPTSVVRESEYDRSAAGQSLINRVKGAAERLTSGGAGVPLAELEKFYALAQEAVKTQTGAYLRSTKERVGRTADRYKIPRDIVFEDVDVTTGPPAAAQAPAGGGAALPKGRTFKAQQNGVTYEITTDANGVVVSQKVVK